MTQFANAECLQRGQAACLQKSMHTHCYELPIRVLFSRDGRDYVAHALELDLVAYGKTEKGAMDELQDTMTVQMSYASQENKPELVYNPAPKEFFDRWEAAQAAALRGTVSHDRPAKMETKAIFVTFSEEDVKALGKKGFKRTTEAELVKTA